MPGFSCLSRLGSESNSSTCVPSSGMCTPDCCSPHPVLVQSWWRLLTLCRRPLPLFFIWYRTPLFSRSQSLSEKDYISQGSSLLGNKPLDPTAAKLGCRSSETSNSSTFFDGSGVHSRCSAPTNKDRILGQCFPNINATRNPWRVCWVWMEPKVVAHACDLRV